MARGRRERESGVATLGSCLGSQAAADRHLLNAVEGFFAKLTTRRLRRGVFGSIVELQAATNCFPPETSEDPKRGPPILRAVWLCGRVVSGTSQRDADFVVSWTWR